MIDRRRAIMSDNIVPDDAIIIAKRSENEKALMDVIYAQGWSESSNYMRKAEAEVVTSIGTAFKGNTKITDFSAFKYFSSVTTLNAEEFNGCTNLSVIELPLNLTTIGNDAFKNCIFERIEIPDSVTTMYVNTFNYCTKLKYLYIGKGFNSYSVNANKGRYGTLDTIVVHPDNPYMHSPDNCNAVVRKYDNALIIGGCNSVIHPSVKTIFNGAFRGVPIKRIFIPNTLEKIASFTFHRSSLEIVETTSDNCSIGGRWAEETPYYNNSIETFNILCGSLWKINYTNNDIVIPSNVKYLTAYMPNNSVTQSIKKVFIPDSVKEFGSEFGRYMTGLEYLDIGTGIEHFPAYTFQNIPNTCTVIIRCNKVASLHNYSGACFKNYPTIYVPDELLDSYKNSRWKVYTIKPISELTT